MTNLSQYIEHTLLKQDATKEELTKLFDEAKKYNFKGVCVNPINVATAKKYLNDTDVKIVTVVGFPLGANVSEVKAFETEKAVKDGADEIDMVINIGALKDKKYDYVLKEISEIKKWCGTKILKVIIETCLLTEEEKIKLCKIVSESGADFIKTSTGFSISGATFDDVNLFKSHISPNVKIKAAGGIKTLEEAEKFINLGASRLGTSKIVKIAKNMQSMSGSGGQIKL